MNDKYAGVRGPGIARALVLLVALAFSAAASCEPLAEPYAGWLQDGAAGRFYEAARAFELAVRADPEDRGAWRGLSRLYRAQGHKQQALTVLQRAERHFPGDADLLVLQGEMLSGLGRYRDAEQVLARALRVGPRDTRRALRAHLSALRAVGDDEAAGRELARLMALGGMD